MLRKVPAASRGANHDHIYSKLEIKLFQKQKQKIKKSVNMVLLIYRRNIQMYNVICKETIKSDF